MTDRNCKINPPRHKGLNIVQGNFNMVLYLKLIVVNDNQHSSVVSIYYIHMYTIMYVYLT